MGPKHDPIFFFGLTKKGLYACLALVFFGVAQSMLTSATSSRSASGGGNGLAYKTTSAVLLIELVKLTWSTFFWYRDEYGQSLDENGKVNDGLQNWTIKSCLMYSVPGLTYAFQNSVVFYSLALLGPPTFQILSNFKIIATAILFRIVLKRILTNIQWCAVVLLLCAMMCSKIRLVLGLGQETNAWGSESDLYLGIVLVLINGTLSGFSGICNEFLIKKIDPSAPLNFKNMQLYFFGVVLNLLSNLFLQGDDAPAAAAEGVEPASTGFFKGFTFMVWILIINNSVLGLSISYIMKHANNVIKCFAAAIQVYLTSYLSYLFFDQNLDASFLVGLVILTCSLFLYMGNHNKTLLELEKKNFESVELKNSVISP